MGIKNPSADYGHCDLQAQYGYQWKCYEWQYEESLKRFRGRWQFLEKLLEKDNPIDRCDFLKKSIGPFWVSMKILWKLLSITKWIGKGERFRDTWQYLKTSFDKNNSVVHCGFLLNFEGPIWVPMKMSWRALSIGITAEVWSDSEEYDHFWRIPLNNITPPLFFVTLRCKLS